MKSKILMVILFVFGLSTTGLAQMGDARIRLMGAIEKTDEVINRAGEAVQESGSERARNQLDMAVHLQSMARQLAQQIDNGPINWADMAEQAGSYTIRARDKAQRAIAITRQATENEDYVRARLEKTDEMIRRLEEQVGGEAPQGLRLMLDSARDKQQRAVELFRNRRLKASLQMTLQVEKSLREASENAGSYQKAQQRYRIQEERYYALRERIELGGDENRPQVRQAFENAERLRSRAESLASGDGRYGQAEKLMQQAVETLTRVAEEQREPATIGTALEDMKTVAEHMREQVEKYGDKDIRRQYQAAMNHLEKAGAMYQRSDYEGAAAQVQAARQIMTRIAEIVEEPALIEHGLEVLRTQESRMEARVAESGDPQLQKEFAEAGGILAKASALYRAADYRAAAAQLEMAERMLARIAHALGE